MVFRAGLRDSRTQDVARFLPLRLVYFYPFRKSSNIPSAWITQSCRENNSVIVLKNFSHKFFCFALKLSKNVVFYQRHRLVPNRRADVTL